jgi:hypothetical protein
LEKEFSFILILLLVSSKLNSQSGRSPVLRRAKSRTTKLPNGSDPDFPKIVNYFGVGPAGKFLAEFGSNKTFAGNGGGFFNLRGIKDFQYI